MLRTATQRQSQDQHNHNEPRASQGHRVQKESRDLEIQVVANKRRQWMCSQRSKNCKRVGERGHEAHERYRRKS